MADVITRFKLETSQFDSKLRDTAKALHDIAHQAEQGGKDFNNFSQKAIETARALGTVQSGANNTKDKLRDLVGSYNDAAKAYNSLTETAKKGEFGQAMSASLTQLQQRIRETKEELYGLGDGMKGASGGSGFKDMLSGVAGKFGMSASMFTGVGASVAGAAGVFKLVGDNINLAMNFEKSMSQLLSLTGMVGKDLDQLKEYAIELGSTSTLTASQVADAFRLIGSQQPQLLESGQALKEVTKYAITLSEAAGIDLQTAAQTLSTSINQMGGDSNNAARYVNVLAAASQKGAGDIAWLGEAITKAATAAKAVGTDYEELVANLEQLAKAGFDASTAGTALRSIIMNLEKQANNDFKPSVVGLTQAFANLGKANLDIVGYQQIAGKMFASQAMALANAAQEAKNMTTAITGTNTAVEQASTNTANLDGALKGLSSAWEGFNLHINSSSGFLKDCVDWAAELIRKLDGVATAGGRAAKALQQMNGAGGSAGPTKVDQQINALKGSNHKRAAFNLTMQSYRQQLADYDQKIANGGKWESKDKPGFFHYENVDVLKAQRAALAQMAKEFQTRGLRELNYTTSTSTSNKGKATLNIEVEVDDDEGEKSLDSLKAKLKELKKLRDDAINKKDFKARDTYNAQIKQVNAEIKNLRGGSITTTTPKVTTADKVVFNPNKAALEATKAEDTMPSVWKMMGGDEGLRQMMGIGQKQFDLGRDITEKDYKKLPGYKEDKETRKLTDEISTLTSGLSSIAGGLKSMGIDLPEEVDQVIGVIQGVTSVIEGVNAIISIFSTSAMSANTAALIANTVALNANTVTSFIPFANGGVVPSFAHGGLIGRAAGGMMIPGNSMSGDRLRLPVDGGRGMIGVNSGELVLNRAQQGNLASQLEGVGQMSNGTPYITGELIFMGLNNYLKSTGRGEIMTSRFKG